MHLCMPTSEHALPPSTPNHAPLEVSARSVAFELRRGRETEMLDVIIVDCLSDHGEVTVRMVDGVRQHEVRTRHGHSYVVQVYTRDDDPSIVRVVTMAHHPITFVFERVGWWLGLGVSAAFVAYMILVVMNAPSVPVWLLLLTPFAAIAIFIAVLLLAWMARLGVEQLLASRGHPNPEAEELAREMFASLHRRAAPRPGS
jgi:hypothetical protein